MTNFIDKDIVEEIVPVIERNPMTSKMPAGYIPIKMSTKGRLGVPSVVHVRNFTTEDLLDLSMGSDAILPVKTIQALNRIIFEENVDVAQWPEKSVLELIVKIYSNFFTPFISDIPFPWNDEDIEYLKSKEETTKIESLKAGTWVPKVDINLTEAVTIRELDSDVKDIVTISKKDGSFKASFSSYPKIGDIIVLKDALSSIYKKEDAEWDLEKRKLEVRNRMIEKGNTNNLPEVASDAMDKYYEFEAKKTMTLVKLTQALYLRSFMGEDLSHKSLSEKLKYFEDPRLDINVTKKIEAQFEKIQFGLNDEISIKNPITGKLCTRRFTFRPMDILQAIRAYESPDYDISYDD